MIRLKNIEKNNNIIQCDIIPEDSNELGHLSIDIDTKKIIEQCLPDNYEWCKKHIQHAKDTLMQMVMNEKIEKEKLVMWN